MINCHIRVVGWDVGRPKSRIDKQNIVVYNIDVLKRKYKINIKELKGKKTMTFSEFETRLNYYFNSTSERDVYALEKIFDGDVYPTMSTDEKKELYEHLNSQYSDFYTGYTLLKMIKNYNPDAFVEQCREVTEEERIVNNFVYIIFFDDKIFED